MSDETLEVGVEESLLAKDHPLRELMTDTAPGTASHSERIANLIEAIGTALHLNVQKLRCAALLHDIGKTVTPWIYSENQGSVEEKEFHDQVRPDVSAALLSSHVAHTARILLSYPGIPRDVIEWCIQHHGTCVIQYPYKRALKLDPAVSMDDFRYPGPKPGSLEACILMICDRTEAKTRSLSQAGRLDSCEGVVDGVFDELADDHQIDSVPFVFWQIPKLKSVLTRELSSSYHSRVDYDKAGEEAIEESTPPKGE